MSDLAIKYVNSLELAELAPLGTSSLPHFFEGAVAPGGAAPSGYVDAGSLMSFVAGVSPQSQRDALNCTLLAQLAANKKFDRENDTVNWYKFYREVLENVGWVIQDFNFTKYNANGSSFSMDQAVLELVAAIATGDQLSTVKATLDALKALKGTDGRLVLFESNSHSLTNGNFQIGVAGEEGGVLAMRIGAFHFNSTQNVTNVLWFSFSSGSTNLYKGGQGMSLNKEVYDKVRTSVVNKLGDKAQKYVADLEI